MPSQPPNADEPAPGRRAYRVFHLAHDGRVCQAETIEAETDDEAKAIAAQKVNGCGIDLWERARFLESFPSLADQG